jgi:hypothetical protein
MQFTQQEQYVCRWGGVGGVVWGGVRWCGVAWGGVGWCGLGLVGLGEDRLSGGKLH